MNYAGIAKTSFVDGEGCRVVLFVTGCGHHCPGCHNEAYQDPEYGEEMTTETLDRLCKLLRKPFVDGLTISGGDPMYGPNRGEIRLICSFLKHEIEGLNIWLYTGYSFEEIEKDPVLEYLDVVVDGRYMKDLPPAPYRGSCNQRIWRKDRGIWRPTTTEL